MKNDHSHVATSSKFATLDIDALDQVTGGLSITVGGVKIDLGNILGGASGGSSGGSTGGSSGGSSGSGGEDGGGWDGGGGEDGGGDWA